MKKVLLTAALSALTVAAVRADVLYSDAFNYFDGPLIQVGTNANGTTNWFRHSGTASPSDSIVKNKRVEISASSPGAVPRQDDVHCNFSTFTNTQNILYSSFTVRCTNLPPVTGTYIAHFYVNSTTFHGRVYAQAGSLSGTWRLGNAGAGGVVSKVFPVDLAPNVDYQVVVQWDPVSLFAATLWVNPLTSADPNVISSDAVSSPAASVGYGFRQAGTFGSAFFAVTNLVVANNFEEAATNVWSTNAVAPIIVSSPSSGTNFPVDSISLSAIAAGQGIANFTFQWQKDGADIVNPDGNTNVLNFPSAAVSDSGNYRMIATTPFGLSVTSAVANIWVTNEPVKPIITSQPASTNVFYHQSVALHVGARGPQPVTYQWYYNSAPATSPNVSGANTDTITISDIFTNNGTAGAYYLVISNPYGNTTSTVANVNVSGPPAVSVAFLRTLVDSSFNPTNSSLRWQATGTVTTFTNLTSGDTSSYYLQDGTAGINIFVTRGHDFRPPQGVSVTFIGLLSSFNSTLELLADTNDLTTSFFINTNVDGSFISNALPAPKVIPFNITNSLAATEALEGSIVMLTNVFFGTNAGTTISTNANQVVTVTNAAGERFLLAFAPQDLDTAGQTFPSFAYSVIGVLNQNLGNAVTPRNQGYQIAISRFSDIVTDAPPAAVVSIDHTGNNTTLSWPNVPWDNVNYSYGSNYSYSVLAAQSAYTASLNGAAEVPANGSTAKGSGRVVVHPNGTNITVNFSFSGLATPATAAHIHGPAPVGAIANVLFGFTGVPAATSGSIPEQTFTLNPTQAFWLATGQLYMNVHNSTYPGGEIRDQLRPAVSVTGPYVPLYSYQAQMLGINDANSSTATGFGRVVLSPDQTSITVDMSFSGLTTPATAAHIHGPAGAGTIASVLFPFSGVPAATSGSMPQQTFTVASNHVFFLQQGLLYKLMRNI